MESVFCLFALIFISFFDETEAQGTCESPTFPLPGGTNNGLFAGNTQVIVPTMTFSGCGVIRDWTVVGSGGGQNSNRDRIIELQLFRPDSARSTVFTKVTSSVVTTNVNQQISTHTFSGIDFTFSPGDVLGFYYPSTGNYLQMYFTTTFRPHSILRSFNPPPTNPLTLAVAAQSLVPRMSVSVELSCGFPSMDYIHDECVCSFRLLHVVSCMECPTSVSVSLSSEQMSTMFNPSSSIAMSSGGPSATPTNSEEAKSNSPSVSTSIMSSLSSVPEASSSNEPPATSSLSPTNTVSPSLTTGEVPSDHITTSSSSQPSSSSTEVVVPVDNPTPPGSPGAAIGGAVGVVVVVVLVLILLSVVVAVCVVKKKRKNRFGNTHVQDPSTFGVSENEKYTSLLKQQTPIQDKIYTELNTRTVYASLDPQTTQKDGEYTHVLMKESTLDVTPTHQCTPPSRVVGGGAHSTSGDKLYTALDPQTTQSDTTYAPLNGAGLLNHDTYIDVLDGHEGEAVYVETRTPQEQMMLSSLKCKIPSKSLTLGTAVHSGAHTTVHIAKMRRPNGLQEEVAVKLVKEGAPPEYTLRLLEEAAILQELQHHHILHLVRVVDGVDRLMMVTEYLSTGSLERYLTHARTSPSELSSPDLPSLLLQFCKQVVDGLACLARKSFVHRDIAARNILLDKDLNCKITGFDLTHKLDNDQSFTDSSDVEERRVRWTAPEALMYKKYSTSSDVWSYGMLMYEIWSVGHKPFEDKTVQELKLLKFKDSLPPPPPGCPRDVYTIMTKCWNPSHNERPSASDISGEFCKSERVLLSWKKEDIVSPSAQVLGGPLSDGEGLYKELQYMYYEPYYY